MISGATAAGTIFMVIPVTLSTQTSTLTGLTNVLSLGAVELSVQAAKVSDGAYRIKLGTYSAAIHGFALTNLSITSISYSDT